MFPRYADRNSPIGTGRVLYSTTGTAAHVPPHMYCCRTLSGGNMASCQDGIITDCAEKVSIVTYNGAAIASDKSPRRVCTPSRVCTTMEVSTFFGFSKADYSAYTCFNGREALNTRDLISEYDHSLDSV